MADQYHPVTAQEMASVDFEPYSADLLERMKEKLAETAWRERQNNLRIKMLSAFALLSHTKAELTGMARKESVAESLLAFRDNFAETAEWYRAGAGLLNTIKVRIDIAPAAVETRDVSGDS